MKKTFSKDVNIAVDCKGSLALKKFLVEYALSKGIPVYKSTLEDIKRNDDEYPNVTWNKTNICATISTPDIDYCDEVWISVEEFIDCCDNYNQKTTVKSNNEWSVEINTDDKTIKINDQVISFEAVNKLYMGLYEAIYN